MKTLQELLSLLEADKPTKTKPKVDLGNMFGKKPDQPLVNKKPEQPEEKPEDEPKAPPQHKIASKDETLRKTAGLGADAPDSARDHLANLHSKMAEVPDEDDSVPEPKPSGDAVVPHQTKNLPKVISTAMKAAGFIDPDFHLVANLPGNMSSAIRKFGKMLFKEFTTTPTDEISMIGHVMGMGPNSEAELNAVAAYLKKEGKNLGPGTIDFENIMPGYTADIHHFSAGGIRYMIVRDAYGRYIYSWPENASVGITNQEKLK